MILVKLINNQLSESTRLVELKRLELVNLSRENRYGSRSTKVKYKFLNVNDLLGGSKHLDVTLNTSGHIVTIRFENFMNYFIRNLKSSNLIEDNDLSNLDTLKPAQIKSLISSATIKAMDQVDVRVSCDCKDFMYRFSYKATQSKYNLGFEETRPATRTNPNNLGSVCKHLAGALTAPSRYMTPVIRDLIKLISYDNSILL